MYSFSKDAVTLNTVQDRSGCSDCGTTFALRSDLNNHLGMHLVEHPYPCDKCNLRFCSTQALRRHLMNHLKENAGQESLSACSGNEDVHIIYVAADAVAENIDDKTGIPQKIRLAYAEAFGCREDESGQLELHYISAKPNQELNNFDGVQNIQFENLAVYLVSNKNDLSKENVHQYPQPRQAHYLIPRSSEATLPITVLEQDFTVKARSCVPLHPENWRMIEIIHEMQKFMPQRQRHQHCELSDEQKNAALEKDGKGSSMYVTVSATVGDQWKEQELKMPEKVTKSAKAPLGEQVLSSNYCFRGGPKKHYVSQYYKDHPDGI